MNMNLAYQMPQLSSTISTCLKQVEDSCASEPMVLGATRCRLANPHMRQLESLLPAVVTATFHNGDEDQCTEQGIRVRAPVVVSPLLYIYVNQAYCCGHGFMICQSGNITFMLIKLSVIGHNPPLVIRANTIVVVIFRFCNSSTYAV